MSHLAPFLLRKILHFLANILNHSFAGRRIWGYLALLFAVSVGITFWLTADQVEANTLFQSPQSSPVAQPAPAAQSAEAQPAPAAQPAEAQPAPATQPAAAQPAPAAQPSADQPAPAAQPAEAQPTSNQNASPAEQAAPSGSVRPSRERDTAAPDSEGSSNFILDQAELIDTVVVSGAYIWLCCGVSLFLLVPLVLLFVYIRGRSKLLKEERY